ncbi:hypothetical protein LXL04_012337 [Taraxacum kok-saghyz]
MFKRRRHKFFLEIMEAIIAYQKREGVYLANSIDNRVNFYQPYLQRSIWNSRKWIMKLHALKTKFNSDSAPNEDVEKKDVELLKKIWGFTFNVANLCGIGCKFVNSFTFNDLNSISNLEITIKTWALAAMESNQEPNGEEEKTNFWPVSEEIDRGEIFREHSDDVFVLKLSPMNIIGPHYSVIKEESKTIRHLSSFIEKSEKPKEKGRKKKKKKTITGRRRRKREEEEGVWRSRHRGSSEDDVFKRAQALANILHTQGFKITIIHTEYNAPNHSNYPHFTFKSISDRFHEIEHQSPLIPPEPGYFLSYLNRSCVDPFTNCLTGLLADESNKGSIACLVTDAVFYFTQAVADTLKIPRMVLRTGSLSCTIAYGVLPIFSQSNKDRFNFTKELGQFTDLDNEAPVPEYPLLKVKDVMKMANNPKSYGEVLNNVLKQMKASSGIIWNTIEELEEPSLKIIRHDFPIPSFTIGPLNKYFSASSSSLIEQDKTILSWLDTQAPNSVIYVSFGSAVHITESVFQEVAYGLANTALPFLWVVRGSEWVESLPEKFLEKVGDRGRIVKWCPQQEVLAHPATGCFWTHNGWNSTLESISEGVPMVCSPCFTDQPINARYVSDVWKIGVLLEDGFEKVGIEMAIKRVMADKEGEEMRERISCLKEKVNMSLKEGGSSHRSLKRLVDYISSL